MSIQTLSDAATRMYLASEPLITLLQGHKADLAGLVTLSNQYYTDTLAAALRAEAAGGGGGGGAVPTANVLALLHMTEVSNGTRPLTWTNSVPGGVVFNNWGPSQEAGGRYDDSGFFGGSVYAESASFNPMAVTSASQYTIAGDFTIEGYVDLIKQDQYITQFSSNGTDGGAVRIQLIGREVGGQEPHLIMYAVVNGVFATFETPPLVKQTVGGISGYHYAFQRENGILTFRCNGSLISTATQAITDPLTGYVDLFGAYDRTNGATGGIFRSHFAELRFCNKAVYTGSTYTVPTQRFTL